MCLQQERAGGPDLEPWGSGTLWHFHGGSCSLQATFSCGIRKSLLLFLFELPLSVLRGLCQDFFYVFLFPILDLRKLLWLFYFALNVGPAQGFQDDVDFPIL